MTSAEPDIVTFRINRDRFHCARGKRNRERERERARERISVRKRQRVDKVETRQLLEIRTQANVNETRS